MRKPNCLVFALSQIRGFYGRLFQGVFVKSRSFKNLNDETLGKLADGGAFRKLSGGATLLKQGDPSDHLFMVIEGRFKMTSLADDGGQTTLRFMNPGDIIGCAAVFHQIPYPATATAAEQSVVLSWKTTYFEKLLHESPQLTTNVLAIVGGRAFEILQRLRGRSEGAEQRIARAILKQAGPGQGLGSKEIEVSRQDLAELSDVSLFTVSRIVSRWSREKIIAGARKKIVIINPEKLAEISSGRNKHSV